MIFGVCVCQALSIGSDAWPARGIQSRPDIHKHDDIEESVDARGADNIPISPDLTRDYAAFE